MLKAWVIAAVLFICSLAVIIILIHERDSARQEALKYKTDLEIQNTAISMMKQRADEATVLLKKAEEKATKNLEKSQVKVSEIMKQHVPDNCLLAIRWAALEAIKMRQE